MGIPATGRTVTVEPWTLDRYRDGQLTESRIIMDVAGLLIQLDVLGSDRRLSAVTLARRAVTLPRRERSEN